jgi:hypothetical protein
MGHFAANAAGSNPIDKSVNPIANNSQILKVMTTIHSASDGSGSTA